VLDGLFNLKILRKLKTMKNQFAPGVVERHKKPFATPAQWRELFWWLRITIVAMLVALVGGAGAGFMSASWAWIAPHLGPMAATAVAMLPVLAFLWALHHATKDTQPEPPPHHQPPPPAEPLSQRGRFWLRYTTAIVATLGLAILAAVMAGNA
jgi:ABC-type amino acid transport system permease subunit